MLKNLPALRNERAEALGAAELLLDQIDQEDRAFTPEEQRQYDRHLARATAIGDELNGDRRPVFQSLQPSGVPDSTPISGLGDTRGRIEMLPGIRLQAYPNNVQGRAAAHTAGRFLAATFLRHPASMRWCEQQGVRYDPMAALSGGVNTAGGALVPDEMGRTIIELLESYGAFRANADGLPMSSDSLTVPRRTGGLTAHYVGENTEGSESDASWDNVTFVAKKLMCLTRMSSEVAEDAIVNLGDKMTQEVAYAFSIKEDAVGFTGTGLATDGGQVGVLVAAIDGNHALAKVAAASGHDKLNEIDADDLLNLMAAIPTFAKGQAKWYCSPTAKALVFDAIKISGGGNSFENLANAPAPSFLGYPIVVSPVFADSASATYNSAVMLAFGNLAQAATIATRREIRVSLSEHRYFELDQIGIRGTMRHSIVVHDLGSASIRSPFAVLTGTT